MAREVFLDPAKDPTKRSVYLVFDYAQFDLLVGFCGQHGLCPLISPHVSHTHTRNHNQSL